jgi:hypothetical protein
MAHSSCVPPLFPPTAPSTTRPGSPFPRTRRSPVNRAGGAAQSAPGATSASHASRASTPTRRPPAPSSARVPGVRTGPSAATVGRGESAHGHLERVPAAHAGHRAQVTGTSVHRPHRTASRQHMRGTARGTRQAPPLQAGAQRTTKPELSLTRQFRNMQRPSRDLTYLPRETGHARPAECARTPAHS